MWTLRPPKQEFVVYVAHEHPQEKYWCCCGDCTRMKNTGTTAVVLVRKVLRFLVGDTKNDILLTGCWFLGTFAIGLV